MGLKDEKSFILTSREKKMRIVSTFTPSLCIFVLNIKNITSSNSYFFAVYNTTTNLFVCLTFYMFPLLFL